MPSFLMITFQRDESQVLEIFLGCKNGKRLEKIVIKGEILCSSGAYYGQEETCLRFNQAEGNVKDLLVILIDIVWKCQTLEMIKKQNKLKSLKKNFFFKPQESVYPLVACNIDTPTAPPQLSLFGMPLQVRLMLWTSPWNF